MAPGRGVARGALAFALPSRLIFLSSLLTAALICLWGCGPKKNLTSAEVRGISRELVAAAHASGGSVETGMRPEASLNAAGKAAAPSVDEIFITIPLTQSGQPNRALQAEVERNLARIAARRGLKRVDREEAPGIERFDYFFGKARTHSIHVISPLAGESAARSAPGQPRLAIVIDDFGYERAQADALFRLPYPLTISVLPHLQHSADIAEEAHRRGYEVLLHLPMASRGGEKDEAVELRPGMDAATVQSEVAAMLETVPDAVGVNNHQGSSGTSDPALMADLMPVLRERTLFFLDSRTTPATVAEAAARSAGVPTAARTVFLDDEQTPEAVRRQLDLAVRDAREKGSAIAIGHPHAVTLEVLSSILPQFAHEGVALVFVSDLVN